MTYTLIIQLWIILEMSDNFVVLQQHLDKRLFRIYLYLKMNTEPGESKGTGTFRWSWLAYIAGLLSVFSALAVLTGREYAQAYWNVFGLTPEIIGTTTINYAVISTNALIASIFLAIGTVIMLVVLWRQPFNIIGDRNPKVLFNIGIIVFIIGLTTTVVIMQIDTSKLTPGIAGMFFGLGYLFFVGGLLSWIQAALKLEEKKELKKWGTVIINWAKNIPPILINLFFLIVLASISFYIMLDTSARFGANEAKLLLFSQPDITLQLDSPIGFEDIVTSNTNGAALLKVRIITEAGGFLYVSPGYEKKPFKIFIRTIPLSRIQAIQYSVGITPLGR